MAGNADFVLRIAAYRVAIEECLGRALAVDNLDQATADLSAMLHKAMTRPVAAPGRRGPDEPDVAVALDQYARHLGSVCGDEASRRAVSAVHAVLNYRLGLGDPPSEIVVDNADFPRVDSAQWEARDHPDRLSDAEHLVGWLVATLFDGTEQQTRTALLHWLDGRRVPDVARDLPALVRRLRVAVRTLDEVPATRPPCPTGLPPNRWRVLVSRLACAVDLAELTGNAKRDGRHVTLAALPPLWTQRRPAVLLLTAHLRVLSGHRANRDAPMVAAHGVRAPVQFVQNTTVAPPGECCDEASGDSAPAADSCLREPVPAQEICPHRPWGEIGWVENYHTLGETAECGANALSKRLERYRGPWPELLWV